MVLRRLMSAYLLLVAGAVAVHFVVFPLYAYDSDGETMEAALNVWHVLDVLMAAGLALIILTTWRGEAQVRRRQFGGPTPVAPFQRDVLRSGSRGVGLRSQLVRVCLGFELEAHCVACDRHRHPRHVRS